jgi:hypothetical protein
MKTRLIEEVTEEELAPIRENMFAVLNAFPQEAEYVQRMLVEGKIEGGTYTTDRGCSCLFGTIGRVKAMRYDEILKTARSFKGQNVERLFLLIFPGDTPATNKSAAIAFVLIEEWLSR